MAYKTLVKIVKGLHERRGETFLEKQEAERLIKEDLAQYAVLYFLKKQGFDVLADFPALGAVESILTGSFVEGPFEEKPEVKEPSKEYGCETYNEHVIEKIFPLAEIPEQFKNIEILSYGIDNCVA